MIDKMIRCKNLVLNDHVGSLNEWYLKCPPQENIQWKDGRSAKETAKHWVYTVPQQFKDILKTFQLKFNVCSPEFVSKLDNYAGNTRNHDLLIIAENYVNEKVLITIESKADESFAETISSTLQAAKRSLANNPRSNGLKRIENLRLAIFGNQNEDQLPLRYQLLTAVAGTLSEARIQNINKAFFIVQTFVSDESNLNFLKRNKNDLNYFIDYLTHSQCTEIKEGELIGPIRVPGNEFIPGNVDLWIGKYQISI
jgi:hypothetical protein